ncbi:MAG: hypothetical protein HOW97_17970, partial [Catenulispora sp.]|nr:hypothetical protein [Catenulispora sp.]
MPDRGDERGRGGTRTLVTGILAGTEWHPADNPQEATQTAREARDLAVRLRPVLSKLAQAPRGGRRRDLEWLPAVEQLAVDAQYFASWWLPRLEGKSAQSWPSWSADGYADWVKRLDAQRVRTLEMVQGTTPVTRIASVTQLRRGKSAEPPEPPAEPAEPAAAGETAVLAAPDSPPDDEVVEAETAEPPENLAYEPTARHARGKGRIMPIRGGGAPVAEATAAGTAAGLLGAEGGSDETHTGFADHSDPLPRVPHSPPFPGPGAFDDSPAYDDPNETHVSGAPVADAPTGFAEDDQDYQDYGGAAQSSSFSEPGTFDEYDDGALYDDPTETHISRVPPATGLTGSVDFEDLDYETVSPATPRIPRTPPNTGPVGFEDLEHEAPHEEPPRVPRTPPFTGPDTFDDIAHEDPADQPTHVPRTPPNTGPVGPFTTAGTADTADTADTA